MYQFSLLGFSTKQVSSHNSASKRAEPRLLQSQQYENTKHKTHKNVSNNYPYGSHPQILHHDNRTIPKSL